MFFISIVLFLMSILFSIVLLLCSPIFILDISLFNHFQFFTKILEFHIGINYLFFFFLLLFFFLFFLRIALDRLSVPLNLVSELFDPFELSVRMYFLTVSIRGLRVVFLKLLSESVQLLAVVSVTFALFRVRRLRKRRRSSLLS
mmetsp:Transcript_4546/g.4275  ORF Transcript_4546/g.4275 Transcript_4546/m.4275 type:complete len:144 (-) Transcript_4546:1533-1964(-)